MFAKFGFLVLVLSASNAEDGTKREAWKVLEEDYGLSEAKYEDELAQRVVKDQIQNIARNVPLAHHDFSDSYNIPEEAAYFIVLGSREWKAGDLKGQINQHWPEIEKVCGEVIAGVGIEHSRQPYKSEGSASSDYHVLVILVFGAQVYPENHHVMKTINEFFPTGDVKAQNPDDQQLLRYLQRKVKAESTWLADLDFTYLSSANINVEAIPHNLPSEGVFLLISGFTEDEVKNFDVTITAGEKEIQQVYQQAKESKLRAISCSRGRTWTSPDNDTDRYGKPGETTNVHVVIAYIPQKAVGVAEKSSHPEGSSSPNHEKEQGKGKAPMSSVGYIPDNREATSFLITKVELLPRPEPKTVAGPSRVRPVDKEFSAKVKLKHILNHSFKFLNNSG